MLPTPNTTVLARRTLIPHRTAGTRTGPIDADLQTSFFAAETVDCTLTRGALVLVIALDVGEVCLVEPPRSLSV